jgi:4-hydroxythreonine-4-phosphate dehydrogenase
VVRLAVTLGDPRGIGPEIVEAVLKTPPPGAEFVLVGPDNILKTLGGDHDSIGIGEWSGEPDERLAGQLAAAAITKAAKLAMAGEVDGIVTAPIDKHALNVAGVSHPGHTEMLGELAGCDVVMMLAVDKLRVVLLTTHIPLASVPGMLTTAGIISSGKIAIRGLEDLFGIRDPKVAICALNPHAGEQGLLGDEEDQILRPAVEALGASGPHPADTVFVRCLRGEFDVVLAPYHDVGMTAVKVAGFGRGVNVTLGLPFVRTSPDHGTAMDIAGKGRADSSSMKEAISTAIEVAQRRKS